MKLRKIGRLDEQLDGTRLTGNAAWRDAELGDEREQLQTLVSGGNVGRGAGDLVERQYGVPSLRVNRHPPSGFRAAWDVVARVRPLVAGRAIADLEVDHVGAAAIHQLVRGATRGEAGAALPGPSRRSRRRR